MYKAPHPNMQAHGTPLNWHAVGAQPRQGWSLPIGKGEGSCSGTFDRCFQSIGDVPDIWLYHPSIRWPPYTVPVSNPMHGWCRSACSLAPAAYSCRQPNDNFRDQILGSGTNIGDPPKLLQHFALCKACINFESEINSPPHEHDFSLTSGWIGLKFEIQTYV